jgi:hypothetical protein
MKLSAIGECADLIKSLGRKHQKKISGLGEYRADDINFSLFWLQKLNQDSRVHGMVKKAPSHYCPFKKQDIQLFIG